MYSSVNFQFLYKIFSLSAKWQSHPSVGQIDLNSSPILFSLVNFSIDDPPTPILEGQAAPL